MTDLRKLYDAMNRLDVYGVADVLGIEIIRAEPAPSIHSGDTVTGVMNLVETHFPLKCEQFSPLRGTPPRTWTSSGAEGRETLTLKGRFEVFPGSTVEAEIICDACQGYRTVQAEWSEQAGRPCEKCKGKGTL